tara:strand:+ start:357 stop:734 length:378 start_codon:yes stop_codon:yes gene_type:complete
MRLKLIAAVMAITPVFCSAQITNEQAKEAIQVMTDSMVCEAYGKYSDTIASPYIHNKHRGELVNKLASKLSFKKSISFRNTVDNEYSNIEIDIIKDIENGIELDWLDCTEVSYRAARIIRLIRDK